MIKSGIQFALLLLFALVLLDSLLIYVIKANIGYLVPVNAVLPFALLVVGLKWGFRRLTPPLVVLAWLSVMCIGFMLGIGLNPDIAWQQVLSLGAAVAAFIIGYAATRWTNDEEAYSWMFLVVGGLYVIVCVIALLEILPDRFPVIDKLWLSERGISIRRPEVMADQNFQVFYLIPVPLIFALRFDLRRFVLGLILTVGALYVMARLQTRSGMLVLASVLLIAWVTPFFRRGAGKLTTVVLPVIVLIAVVVNLGVIMEVGDPLIERFTSLETYITLDGRVLGAKYLFDHIFEPAWWVARGNQEFLVTTGNIPHFNPTAMYLQGGMLGLIAWVALVPVPLVLLAVQFVRRRLDSLGSLVFIAGIAVFVSQLALNTPLFEQIWIWAGAAVGVYYRQKSPAMRRLAAMPVRR